MSEPLDRSRLAEVLRGSEQPQAVFLAEFRRCTDADVQILQDAAATGDLAGVARMAHRIEGAARVIGAWPVAQASGVLARAGSSGGPGALRSALAALVESRDALYACIETLLPAVRVPAIGGAGPRICEGLVFLVVEDHDFQRGVVVRLLRQLGALEVRGFADGASALAAARESPTPAVMVLDLAMPALGGTEVLRIAALERLPLAVIISSAQPDHLLRRPVDTARSNGVTVLGAVSKPLTAAKLAPLLAQYRHDQCRPAPEPSSGSGPAGGGPPKSDRARAVPAVGPNTS
ncbi:MAG: response regulator receiver (CheY-like) modulated diguanylate phosphodiesterase domain [Ramlibacter sp.]|nr:response regulator receiver (CheY-like) modulated diguanylate phosphodiesterase domain [Ramlibacter sp.]